MTLTQTIGDIAIQTLANVISNLAWFILIVWGVRIVSREIARGVKQVPEWIDSYHRKSLERIRIQEALDRRGK